MPEKKKKKNSTIGFSTQSSVLSVSTQFNFGPNLGITKFFSWVLHQIVARQCSKLSSHANSRKTNEPNFKKGQKKTNFGRDSGSFG